MKRSDMQQAKLLSDELDYIDNVEDRIKGSNGRKMTIGGYDIKPEMRELFFTYCTEALVEYRMKVAAALADLGVEID